MAKIRDLTMLTDIFPTGFHGAIGAKVGVGSTVYVAGAGPVGLAAAASARLLGAAVTMIGDFNAERLAHAKKMGFEPIDLSKHDRLGEMIAAGRRCARGRFRDRRCGVRGARPFRAASSRRWC